MLYTFYEAGYYAASPLRWAALAARDFWSSPLNPAADSEIAKRIYATSDLFANLTRRYGRPEWMIDQVKINGRDVRVRTQEVWSTPWCKLTHFARDMSDLRRAGKTELEPAVLIAAPLSGHYATLLRGTVEAFLQDHEVFITEWTNARDVPIVEGRFDFHDYIDHIREMLRQLGPRPHVVAVCQPGPPVLAAAALMAEDEEECRPASMTFMGSPIDARLSPTVTNKLAEDRPFGWFESNMIYNVPPPHLGAGRRVYPGFVQLASFMSMNLEKHQEAHRKYLAQLMAGDGDSAEKHLEFYDEYLSVLDLTEEFYLQTIDVVFQRYLLPKGELEHRGRKVRPERIADIGLLTVEGENDDISGIGQTQAAHRLCLGLPDELKEDYIQPLVGHYGVFNGKRFREEIYPRVRDFVRRMEKSQQRKPAAVAAKASEQDGVVQMRPRSAKT
ncbi:MAG: polyhydroxyalkanoate depolymerase [Phenylobacterium sp.]|uniref:polyhydroxyalkanoate depolymerase n=1 Tax=Phenylobacterium sp. TaxID=1871053 RepID=UPI001A399696|nr:polyhydroxyalkanoate depolymerase [Phenylobacterium sp.]MBL8556526.1 polyhydroxyalkanoate depolymerase [Phenylobacterium sp.]